MNGRAALIVSLMLGCQSQEDVSALPPAAARTPVPEDPLTIPAPRDLGAPNDLAAPPRSPPQLIEVSVGPAGALSFSPSVVKIRAGGTVRWTWHTGVHTVTSGVPGAIDGLFCSLHEGQTPGPVSCAQAWYLAAPPYSFTHTFDTTGSYPYFCLVHPVEMVGIVTVTSP